MRKLEAVAHAAAASSGPRPHFLESADCDRLLSMLLAVASQLSAVNERLDTLEKVLENNGLLGRDALAAYQPDDAVQAERLEWDQAFVTRMFRVLSYELDALKASDQQQS
ncbi:MAG TPA: hypothetical protein PKY87_00795 [Terricaulis sp.]|nr:hypothetical protein [Terricaulis sp.]